MITLVCEIKRMHKSRNSYFPISNLLYFFKINFQFYLIGLPALHQLLVSKDFFNYLCRLVTSHLPQTMFSLSQWQRLTMPSQSNIEKVGNEMFYELLEFVVFLPNQFTFIIFY